MYRETCRNFYKEHCEPFHKEWEKAGEVPRDLWKEAGSQGMLAVTTPEECVCKTPSLDQISPRECGLLTFLFAPRAPAPPSLRFGGMGVDILYSAVHWEEQSYSGCTGPGFALHSEVQGGDQGRTRGRDQGTKRWERTRVVAVCRSRDACIPLCARALSLFLSL